MTAKKITIENQHFVIKTPGANIIIKQYFKFTRSGEVIHNIHYTPTLHHLCLNNA